MSLSGFNRAGEFVRGNLHCHSDHSDGCASPDQVVRAYATAGYDFLAISDHFEARFGWPMIEPADYPDAPLTLLRGAELSSSTWDDPAVYWVVAIGLPERLPVPADGAQKGELIARAHRDGAFVGLVHPNMSDLSDEAALRIADIDAVEVFNQDQVFYDNRPEGWDACDALLRSGRRVSAFASDDAHFNHQWSRFGAWVEVKVPTREPAGIVAALKGGHYYSTQGPLLEALETSKEEIWVRSTPVRALIATGADWRDTQRVVDDEVVEASFPLDRFRGGYVRITAVDFIGRRAWSNPVHLDG